MLLERPLSLKQIFHYYTQLNNRERDRSYTNERSTYIFFLIFFFFFPSLFCSFRVGLLLSSSSVSLLLVCSCFFFFFLLHSIPAFFFVLFVDVVLWCLKTVVYGNQVRFESLKNSAGHMHQIVICCIYIHLHAAS